MILSFSIVGQGCCSWCLVTTVLLESGECCFLKFDTLLSCFVFVLVGASSRTMIMIHETKIDVKAISNTVGMFKW